MFERIQQLELGYFDRTPTGWLMSRATSDASRVGDLVSWGFLDIAWTIMSVTTSLVFMFIISWRMTLIVLVMIPVLAWVSIKFKSRILKEFRLVRKINSQITNAYAENISGVRVVKSLRREEKNLDQFGELTDNMFTAGFRAAWLSALYLPLVILISMITVSGIVWFSGFESQVGGIEI